MTTDSSSDDSTDGVPACRSRGSLPFKKRRLLISISPVHSKSGEASVPDLWNSQGKKIHAEESIDALALVASAASRGSLNDLFCFSALSKNGSCTTPHAMLKQTRLVSPLPNGCHGRTTRNNSFCRKQPCYKGSNYCKLHYDQYVTNVDKRSEPDVPLNEIPSTTTLALQKDLMLPNIMHQDRRFIGSPDQTRCLATTTRGRSCAYIAVDSTKYCFLHAGYGTKTSTRRRLDSFPSAHKRKLVSVGESQGLLVPPRGISNSSLQLLSLVPTGKWLHQLVFIAAGHLQNRFGRVERWGNGWVSVRVAGVGLHNRRAFELLVPISDGSNNSVQGAPRNIFISLPKIDTPLPNLRSASNDEASQSSANRFLSVSPIPATAFDDSSARDAPFVSPETPFQRL